MPFGVASAVRVTDVPERRSPPRGETSQPTVPVAVALSDAVATPVTPEGSVTRARTVIFPARWISLERDETAGDRTASYAPFPSASYSIRFAAPYVAVSVEANGMFPPLAVSESAGGVPLTVTDGAVT